MAASPSLSSKGKADDEAVAVPSTKRTELSNERNPTRERQCLACLSTHRLSLFLTVPESCSKNHTSDICAMCMRWWFNIQITSTANIAMKCPQCAALVPEKDLERMMSGPDFEHYKFRLRRATALANGERECLSSSCLSFTKHDPKTDGRVCQCTTCGAKACTHCSIREHDGETCSEFQDRLQSEHGDELASNATALREGFWSKEKKCTGCTFFEFKRPKPCPCCGVQIHNNGCGKLRCAACHDLFCARCDISAFGPGGFAKKGNDAHLSSCSCRARKEHAKYRSPVNMNADGLVLREHVAGEESDCSEEALFCD